MASSGKCHFASFPKANEALYRLEYAQTLNLISGPPGLPFDAEKLGSGHVSGPNSIPSSNNLTPINVLSAKVWIAPAFRPAVVPRR